MPFALGLIGLLLIVSGARGSYSDLKQLLVADFTGQGNFFYWVIALGTVGSLGYVPGMERFSRTFMALIIIAMVLSHRGFFQKFMEALGGLQSASLPAGSANGATDGNGAFGGAGSGVPSVAPKKIDRELRERIPMTDQELRGSVVEEMNKRFGQPPDWLSWGTQRLFGVQ